MFCLKKRKGNKLINDREEYGETAARSKSAGKKCDINFLMSGASIIRTVTQ